MGFTYGMSATSSGPVTPILVQSGDSAAPPAADGAIPVTNLAPLQGSSSTTNTTNTTADPVSDPPQTSLGGGGSLEGEEKSDSIIVPPGYANAMPPLASVHPVVLRPSPNPPSILLGPPPPPPTATATPTPMPIPTPTPILTPTPIPTPTPPLGYGQTLVPAPPPGIPGLARPLMTGQFSAMNHYPPRPGFPTNHLTPPQLAAPPGVYGSSPAGMPRYPLHMYPPPMVRTPPIIPPRPMTIVGPTPMVRPMATMIRPPAAPSLKYSLGMSPADMSKVVGQFILEKPQTTIYVGKIASSLDDEFLRSMLELCGQVKSWKRAQDPSTGIPKGFGFCEFETAEGVLQALRLLNKLSLEGQELVLNVTKATREYLERYVDKKIELEKQRKEAMSRVLDSEVETAPGVEKAEPAVVSELSEVKDDASGQPDNPAEENGKKFGLVNDDDMKSDEEAQKKLTAMLEERSKQRPLPPPPPLPAALGTPTKSNSVSETPAMSRDIDPNVDATKSDAVDGKNEDDIMSENKPSLESEFPETSSSDRGRHLGISRERERESRERERERDGKREKDREIERYERGRERERLRREREREMRLREAERRYEERERQWEEREREKERQRQVYKEREKERERERRREIRSQEEESDDEGWRKRRHRGDPYEEMRKRRRREREDDEINRLKEEEEEIAEAKWRKIKEEAEATKKAETSPKQQPELDIPSIMDVDDVRQESPQQMRDVVIATGFIVEEPSATTVAEVVTQNGNGSEVERGFPLSHAAAEMEEKQSISPPPRKLGFGLVGSGKRTAVPSVFARDEEEELHEDLKSRPLIPIDYSVEEMEAVASAQNPLTSGSSEKNSSSNHSAKGGEKRDRASDKHEHHQTWEKDSRVHAKEESRSRTRDKEGKHHHHHHQKETNKSFVDGGKVPEPKKLLDAKQLIDTIPKTKDELFAFSIDWAIYDKHNLHERLRPWISKKIKEYLGEEEATLVDYIVSNTKKHVTAGHMLELLNSIFDDEAEMFVLKMWRMLIFEVRKVETGLAGKN